MKHKGLLLGLMLGIIANYSLAIPATIIEALERLGGNLRTLQTTLLAQSRPAKSAQDQKSVESSDTESSEEASEKFHSAPSAPSIPGAPSAPPLPPAIGIKPKPVSAAPSLPILTQDELAEKSDADKKRSDATFLAMFKDLAVTEYIDNQRFEQAVRKAVKYLRAQSNFLKRKELDALLAPEEGLLALLKKDFAGGDTGRLAELYETFTKVKPEMQVGAIAALLKACLFDASLLALQDVELLVVSSVVSQREPSVARSESAQHASDAVFMLAWQSLSKEQEASFAPENVLNSLARSLNFLRINPAFIRYEDMLWKGAEGTEARNKQKSNKVSPLLVFLMNPAEFIQRAETGVVELKRNAARHLFDLSLYENELSSNSLKAALLWQLTNTKQQILMPLADFVRGRLQKATTLSVLQSTLKSVLQVYEGKLGGQESLVKSLQTEFGKPSLDSVTIVQGFRELAGSLPESLAASLKELIDSEGRDKQIVALVVEAAKDKSDFQEKIIAATEALPELNAQLKAAYTNLYRTPRDIFNVISKQVKNKKLLADNNIKPELFYELVKPYGILLSIFEYYAKRYQLVKADPAKVKLNNDMLVESLQAISNPKKYFSPGTADDKKLKSLKQAAAKSIQDNRALLDLAVAPILLDITVNDQLIGTSNAGYYSDQLSSSRNVQIGRDVIIKMGLYDNLDSLIKMVKENNAQEVVDYITSLVGKAQGVDVESAAFKELMASVKAALSDQK